MKPSKYFTLSLVFTLACAITSTAQSGIKIETEYDRFEDTTTVAFRYIRINGAGFDGLTFNAGFQCQGSTSFCQPAAVALVFVIINKGESYRQPAKLTVLADGERFPIGYMKNIGVEDMRPRLNITITSLSILVPRDAFLKIADADKVEMKLDDTIFTLGAEHRLALYSLSLRTKL